MIKGYKGFKWDGENLYCEPVYGKKYYYKIGETYVFDGDIKTCFRGFHFCMFLNDVHSYYRFPDESNWGKIGDHKFCEIEVPDDAITVSDDKKISTNKIKIVREISDYNEFQKILKNEETNKTLLKIEKVMDTLVVPILEKNPNLVLGGSLALMLKKELPFSSRENFDIDLISPFYINIAEVSDACSIREINLDLCKEMTTEEEERLKELESKMDMGGDVWVRGNERYDLDDKETEEFSKLLKKKNPDWRWSGSDVDSQTTVNGTKIEIFVKPDCKYNFFIYKNKKIKICNSYNIIEAKLRYALGGRGSSAFKHKKDLKLIFNNL